MTKNANFKIQKDQYNVLLQANLVPRPEVVVHVCSPSTWEVEAGRWLCKASLDYTERPCLKKKERNLVIRFSINNENQGCHLYAVFSYNKNKAELTSVKENQQSQNTIQ